MENTSRFRELIAVSLVMRKPQPFPLSCTILTATKILSSIKGDLSNTLSPPFLLAQKSMTEIPLCWIERPSIFAAPALEPDPARRALLFLKWFIISLKAQLYVGENSKLGMKKPLNPFLGELFLGSCTDEAATTHLVVEQVRYV